MYQAYKSFLNICIYKMHTNTLRMEEMRGSDAFACLQYAQYTCINVHFVYMYPKTIVFEYIFTACTNMLCRCKSCEEGLLSHVFNTQRIYINMHFVYIYICIKRSFLNVCIQNAHLYSVYRRSAFACLEYAEYTCINVKCVYIYIPKYWGLTVYI